MLRDMKNEDMINKLILSVGGGMLQRWKLTAFHAVAASQAATQHISVSGGQTA